MYCSTFLTLYARWVFFLSRVDFLSHHVSSHVHESFVYPAWHTSVKLWEVWVWAVRWLWALVSQLLWTCSMKQNGSSSAALPQQPRSGGHLPSLRLKSRSCVTSLSWAAAAGMTSATGKKCMHLWAWMAKVMVLSCVELHSKAGLNFHPWYYHIAFKGGFCDDVAGCSDSIQ